MKQESVFYHNLMKFLPTDFKPDTKKLASKINIKPKRLARLLNGTANKVQLAEIEKIAAFLEIPMKQLFD